jgi:hypothetical protein
MEANTFEEQARNSSGSLLAVLGITILLVIQYGLFRQYAEREVTPFFPQYADQASYLGRSYACYQHILEEGPWSGVVGALEEKVPNGLVFEAEAGLLYLVLGPSRLSALTLNFLHFALLEITLFYTLRWYTGRWGPAFLGLGLVLVAGTPFYVCGGVADFRLDFAAFCLYGIFLCVVLRSGVFSSWRWSPIVGLAAGWLILTRYLTAVYLGGVFIGCLGLLLLSVFRRDPGSRSQTLRRIAGLFLAGVSLAALAAPVVWWKRSLIRHYYLGQFGNSDNLARGELYGAIDLPSRLVFYLRSVSLDHAGVVLLILGGAVLAVGLVVALAWRILARPTPNTGEQGRVPCLALFAPFVLLCLFVPLTALTLFASPSPIVGNVAVVPLVLLSLLPLLALSRSSALASRVAAALAVLLIPVGCYWQASNLSRPLVTWASRAELDEVTHLYERMGELCRQNGWLRPRVAVATVNDALIPELLSPVIYERQGLLLTARPTLGGGISAVSEEESLAAIRNSDIVIVPLHEQGTDLYPFVRCMREYQPRLLRLCQQSLFEQGRFTLPGARVVLFVRPNIHLKGGSAGWITADGLDLVGDSRTFKARPHIELIGRYFPVHLGRAPVVRAELRVPGKRPRPLPASVTVNETEYRLVVDLLPGQVPDTDEVQIHLSFDTYFIPVQRPEIFGETTDSRHLVLLEPATVKLLTGP